MGYNYIQCFSMILVIEYVSSTTLHKSCVDLCVAITENVSVVIDMECGDTIE